MPEPSSLLSVYGAHYFVKVINPGSHSYVCDFEASSRWLWLRFLKLARSKIFRRFQMEARLSTRQPRAETSASSYLFNSLTLNCPLILHPLFKLGWIWKPWDPILLFECQQPNSHEHFRPQCSIVEAKDLKDTRYLGALLSSVLLLYI